MQKKIKRLFKFSGPTAYALENLKDSILYCQHYAAYNDPFEYWARIVDGIPDPEQEPERFIAAINAWGFNCKTMAEAKADAALWEYIEEYFDECVLYAPPFESMRESMRIACFGSEQDNLLMWSHYGDGLRGFCVVFDENLIVSDEPARYTLDVLYLEAPPRVDSFVYGIATDQDWYHQIAIQETTAKMTYQGNTKLEAEINAYEEAGAQALKTMKDAWQHTFATKPSEWSYEKERRLLVQTNQFDNTPLLLNYPTAAIKEVILGERMPESYKDELLTILKKIYPDVPVRTARRAESGYKLTID